MRSNEQKTRNEAIDFLRGCACISIILIHTAWWSGQGYLPDWFSNIFLLFDVPIFMFLAGVSYNYSNSVGKNIKGILKQWNKWVFFLLFYILILFIFFRSEIHRSDLINYIFYKVPSSGSLRVVGGSLWWVSMYIKVTIFCSIILYFYNMHNDIIKFKHLLIFMIFLSVVNIAFVDSYIAIYSFAFLLGYKSHEKKIGKWKDFLLLELLLIGITFGIFKLSNYGISDLQQLKFPPTIYYLLANMPSIVLVWFLKNRIKNTPSRLISYIGKNAIFFFYAQGISSSLLYLIRNVIIIENIYLKFIVLALINIIMAIIIGSIINELYSIAYRILKKIKTRIMSEKHL